MEYILWTRWEEGRLGGGGRKSEWVSAFVSLMMKHWMLHLYTSLNQNVFEFKKNQFIAFVCFEKFARSTSNGNQSIKTIVIILWLSLCPLRQREWFLSHWKHNTSPPLQRQKDDQVQSQWSHSNAAFPPYTTHKQHLVIVPCTYPSTVI